MQQTWSSNHDKSNLAKQDYLREIAAKLAAAEFGGKAAIVKLHVTF